MMQLATDLALDEWQRGLSAEERDERNLQLIELGLHTGVGPVHFKPLLWTTEGPKRPGFYWCRFKGSSDRQVFEVRADVEYVAGNVEWSSGPIPEPWG